ncbi:MAG: nucleotide-binding protein [Pirellulaceae bacterium]|nr:nucleotide-binding protein [Pirellulaceae bacterium]
MARKKSTADLSPPAKTELTIDVSDAEGQLKDRVEKGRELLSSPIDGKEGLEQSRKLYYTWDEYNTTLLKRIFSTEELSQEYSYWGIMAVGGARSLAHEVKEFVGDVNDKIRRLESIIERLPLYGPDTKATIPRPGVTMATTESRKVFVVHGRNNELKETVARYLAQLDLVPVILHEQASAGLTVIEKFEFNSDACFAVILLTPDDVGCLSPAESLDALSKRARQNVVFEWGFFVAKLGRRNVCALVAEGVELPSDMGGVVYVSLDQHGAWKMLLARELKAGRVEIDLNRAI